MGYRSTRLDYHSVIHFVECYAIALTISSLFELSSWWCGGIAFGFGLIWEILDDFNHHNHWGIKFLDPGGADLTDALVDAIGCLLAVGVLSL